jgi:hypothetical protein
MAVEQSRNPKDPSSELRAKKAADDADNVMVHLHPCNPWHPRPGSGSSQQNVVEGAKLRKVVAQIVAVVHCRNSRRTYEIHGVRNPDRTRSFTGGSFAATTRKRFVLGIPGEEWRSSA